jgi:hypothetical protein
MTDLDLDAIAALRDHLAYVAADKYEGYVSAGTCGEAAAALSMLLAEVRRLRKALEAVIGDERYAGDTYENQVRRIKLWVSYALTPEVKS